MINNQDKRIWNSCIVSNYGESFHTANDVSSVNDTERISYSGPPPPPPWNRTHINTLSHNHSQQHNYQFPLRALGNLFLIGTQLGLYMGLKYMRLLQQGNTHANANTPPKNTPKINHTSPMSRQRFHQNLHLIWHDSRCLTTHRSSTTTRVSEAQLRHYLPPVLYSVFLYFCSISLT